MRSFVLILALMFAASCAARGERRETAAHAVAQVMIAAMAPAASGEPGYVWDAVYARVSPPVRWRGGTFEPAVFEGTGLQRNGAIEGRGWEFDVIVQGSHRLVRYFGVDVNDAVETEALLGALREAGAEVQGAGDDETAMFYYVSLPGRDAVKLEARRTCTPYGSREARHCRSIMAWIFEPELSGQL